MRLRYYSTHENLGIVLQTFQVYFSSCVVLYVHILAQMLRDFLANNNNIDSGNDSGFNYHVMYIKDLIPTVLSSFMNTEDELLVGCQYISCTWY